MKNEGISGEHSVELLRALATATTRYFEASPDRSEEARVQYQLALARFNTARANASLTNTESCESASVVGFDVVGG